ncbi:MAG: acetate--CoA ligase family protein [Desulfobaccales bacterium]|nr:acetate--CoA ligase family protein [Desulfobaccales bacterium]
MEKFFYPQSVAVVGVSENPANLARGIISNLREFGYQGKIYPVGPRGGNIYGFPILSHIKDLPESVDLAVILTPARYVPQVVADCGRLGISQVVVESAGFSELNEAGRALEEEIRGLLKKYRMRLVGPNGLGLMNMETGLSLPFAEVRPLPRKGRISIISQSGGVATHLLAWMHQEGLGLNKFLSLGNKLDVAENEALAYLLTDPGTEAIYLYLEGLRDGRELMSLAKKATKPIFLHLVNVGPETAAIGQSHTASLTTDERVLEAACRQGGMVRIKSQGEFLVGAKMVGQPPVKGSRLVVLSRSGGEALVAAYACRRWGFKLPPLSKELVVLIQERARAGVIKPTNPIDFGDIFDFTVYSEVMAALCRDSEVDAVLFHYGPVADFEVEPARQMARHLIEQARTAQKPLAITVLCDLKEEEFFRETLGTPVFHFPEEAVQALALSRYLAARGEVQELEKSFGRGGQWVWPPAPSPKPSPPTPYGVIEGPGAEKISAILDQAPPGEFLPLPQALSLIAALGIPVADWQTASSLPEALAAAQRLGFPVVLKLVAPSLLHKTEAGGVLLDLKDAAAVASGFAKLATVVQKHLPAGESWQVLVMSQATGGREVLLGAKQDPAFGPVIAFGAGGVDTEVLEDVALRVAPLNTPEARAMLAETRIGRILAGIRSQPPADLAALSVALLALSQLMLNFPHITEVDLNPVRAFPGQPGILTLDARIRVGERQA